MVTTICEAEAETLAIHGSPHLFGSVGYSLRGFSFCARGSPTVEAFGSNPIQCRFDSCSRDVGHAHYQIRIILLPVLV